MVEVLIALGANLGRRRESLEQAVAALAGAAGFEVLAVSPWIETLPVGGPPGQPPYLNGALRGRTTLSAAALLALLRTIEAAAGRDRAREERWGPRTLDLDLLFYGEEEIARSDLVVPHPRLEDRAFVLAPLAHLVPDKCLPRCRRTVRERLAELLAASPPAAPR
ncbi:MAG: 2-amino-4-hydroxy-6-hydroxymethyldihydropteridine diphosphokinase [Planctomycetota bacterium]